VIPVAPAIAATQQERARRCPMASIGVTRPNRIGAHHAHGESTQRIFL
jgi:hypothetical protein